MCPPPNCNSDETFPSFARVLGFFANRASETREACASHMPMVRPVTQGIKMQILSAEV